MNIRKFEKSDWEQVVSIYNFAKADEFSGIQTEITIVPLELDHQMLKLFESSDIYVYEDSFIKGFAGIKGFYISWLFIHPQYRRLKIAHKLISHILDTVKGKISLNVAATNMAARNLYLKSGFQVIKEFDSEYQGTPVRVLRMELENE